MLDKKERILSKKDFKEWISIEKERYGISNNSNNMKKFGKWLLNIVLRGGGNRNRYFV